MNILRLSTVALGLAAVLGLLVGWSSPASAHCKDKGPHSDPNHEGCDSEPTATFTVDVLFDLGGQEQELTSVGTAFTAEGKTHGQRRTVSDPGLTLDLTVFDSAGCTIDSMGMREAQFALTTYRNKKTQLFTYVTATFWNFLIGTNGVDYALFFAPDADGQVVDSEAGWLPSVGTGTTSVTGEKVSLSSQTAANADDPCYMDIDISWQIDVTAN
jgi:hypothetical protein